MSTLTFLILLEAAQLLPRLGVIFSDVSCGVSASESCTFAETARQFFVCSSGVGQVWGMSTAMWVLYLETGKSTQRAQSYLRELKLTKLACLLVSLVYLLQPSEISHSNKIALVLLLVSDYAVGALDGAVGVLLHTSGLLVHIACTPIGFSNNFVSHWILFATVFLLTLLSLTLSVSSILYRCYEPKQFIPWIETVTAHILVSLFSCQLFVSLGSIVMISTYSGAVVYRDNWYNFGGRFIIQHVLTLYFTCSLMKTRHEVAEEPRYLVCYYFVPLLCFTGWAVFNTYSYPTHPSWTMALAAAAAVIGWIGVGFGMGFGIGPTGKSRVQVDPVLSGGDLTKPQADPRAQAGAAGNPRAQPGAAGNPRAQPVAAGRWTLLLN